MSGYRRVRVAENELVHVAGTDVGRTIGCGRAVVAEWVLVSDDRPRCGRCVLRWMAATGQTRLVARLPTALPPELAAPRRPVERSAPAGDRLPSLGPGRQPDPCPSEGATVVGMLGPVQWWQWGQVGWEWRKATALVHMPEVAELIFVFHRLGEGRRDCVQRRPRVFWPCEPWKVATLARR